MFYVGHILCIGLSEMNLKMKKANQHTKQSTSEQKNTSPDKKEAHTGTLDDKDEKVQKHRATDIQKPVVNKNSKKAIDKKL